VEPIRPEPLAAAVGRLEAADEALLALGIPRCPACRLLPATLAALAEARPGLGVGLAYLERPEDWASREPLLWPRGIRVSRASVPVLAVLRRGRAVATRQGGAPAAVLDAWLAETLGPAAAPPEPGPSAHERAALAAIAARRAQHLTPLGARLHRREPV
jgi:thioredoxin-like negative regulator of GroEL